MEDIASLFSLFFILAFSIYLFWGIDIFRINPKEGVNRAFLSLSIALCIWSFGYALGNIAANLEKALFWRRMGSAGRMHLFSIILHFVILLTYEKDELPNKWYLVLLHIPAIILTYVFSISAKMAPLQYNLMKIDYGWLDKPVSNIWNKIYYLYFFIYMIATLVVLMRWKERIEDKEINKRANLVFNTMIMGMLFGVLLDILPNITLNRPVPQISVIVILIPVGAMYYAAKYYHVFQLEIPRKTEIVVTEEEKINIFRNLSIGFYVSAVLAFISEYIPYIQQENAFKFAFLKSLTLVGIGVFISLIQRIKKQSRKESLTILVLVLSIPLVTLQYLKYGALTVWAFPMVIIISSIIFSKLTLLILTTIISIITQFFIWTINPEVMVIVDNFDYILRVGIFIVAFLTGIYINRIYVNKIKENKYQIEFQKLGSDISFEFVSLNRKNFDEKINYLLRKIGLFFNVDRTYLFTINHENNTMTYSNEWCNVGINKEVGTIEEIPLSVFPWWIEQLEVNNMVYIKDVDFMPKGASEEQAQLHRQNVKSLVSVPVLGENKIQAFIGMDSVLDNKDWTEENIEMLNIIANLLSSGMTQIKADREVEFLAYYDSLTGLPNRFLFEEKVNQAIHRCKKIEESIAIVFIDLDNFKMVNDTIGHSGGDDLLKQVAKELSDLICKEDLIARFGGDEFVIMVNNMMDDNTINQKLDKVMEVFTELFSVSGQEFLITASAGVSIYPKDGKDSETLVKNAELAMYKAKEFGKNQYELCSEEIKEKIQNELELSNDLHHALERDELCLYYQPQIDLMTNKIIGLEALVRWKHPKRGMISPGIFIPLAEKNNLINSIGEWVLETACRQNKKWQEMGLPPIVMAVNLSAVQIINPKIVENMESVIQETGLNTKYIQLEITENIAINEEDYVIDVLNKLREIGFSIAIDDFGTEYSSLIRLKILPIDQIKIDMQFTQGIETNEKDRAITMAIINLAKNLDLSVLAEGVETYDQLEFLKEKMCDYVQGYYYYRPIPKDEIEKIMIELYKGEMEGK